MEERRIWHVSVSHVIAEVLSEFLSQDSAQVEHKILTKKFLCSWQRQKSSEIDFLLESVF